MLLTWLFRLSRENAISQAHNVIAHNVIARNTYCGAKDTAADTQEAARPVQENAPDSAPVKTPAPAGDRIFLFKTATCPRCREAAAMLKAKGIGFTEVMADSEANRPLVDAYDVWNAPTLVICEGDSEPVKLVGGNEIAKWVRQNS